MATVKVLVQGYVSEDMKEACATVSLVVDKNVVMVVDPGALPNTQLLIDALKKEGFSPEDVNYVCITHSHVDHYRNIGLFPRAKVLEYFGLSDAQGRMEDWQERFSENIQVLKTPGHDYSCITLFVKTDDGVVAICGDVFWKENYPEVDPYATDLKKLEQSRHLVMSMSHWIVPGHASMYKTINGKRLAQIRAGKKIRPVMLGSCRKCKRKFLKFSDKCLCQEWLCYRCCECERDCKVCSCKVKTRK